MGTEKKSENNEAPSVESLQAALAESNELLAIAEAEKKAAITERDNALAAKKATEDRLSETEKRLDEFKRHAELIITDQQESFKAQLAEHQHGPKSDTNPGLVPMYKGDKRIEVHPSAVGGHVEAGWEKA